MDHLTFKHTLINSQLTNYKIQIVPAMRDVHKYRYMHILFFFNQEWEGLKRAIGR